MAYQDVIKKISRIILSELNNIDTSLKVAPSVSTDVFAYPEHAITHGVQASTSLQQTQEQVHLSQRKLKEKPFIAYVKATVDGQPRIFFICRGYTPKGYSPSTPSSRFVNYLSPMGRLVEMDAGDEHEVITPAGKIEVSVFEKDLFKPERKDHRWDGINNRFFLDIGTYSIPSLVDFLRSLESIIQRKPELDLVKDIQELETRLHEELEKKIKIRKGLTREVIEKMELRDQPTLDDKQGEIFRQPLASQLIISGAPGTGKTTLLIKRIAQKCDFSYLESFETSGLSPEQVSLFINKENWILFTPTELLKIYLKESFAKELLPASDQRIKIWEEERMILARDTLKFLRVGDQGFFRKVSRQIVRADCNQDLIEYAETFVTFYGQLFVEDFHKAVDTIKKNNIDQEMISGLEKIVKQLNEASFRNETDRILILVEELYKLQEILNRRNKEVNERIENITNNIIASKPRVLEEVFEEMKSFKSDAEEDLLDEVDEEGETESPTTEYTVLAKRQMKRTLAFHAQRLATDRKIPSKSIHNRVLGIIESFLPEPPELEKLGKRLIDRRAAGLMTRGYTNMLNRIPNFYNRFRQHLLKNEPRLFNEGTENDIKERKICGVEIDLLIFVMLKNARKIFDRHGNLLDENSRIELLEDIKDKYATQIAVDEATDFSTIQLGCMYYLAHPRYTSVSFAGDLMQRVTDFGLTDWEECKFITKNFETHNVDKVYRQSPKLLKIAEVLYEHSVGQAPPFKSAFLSSDADPSPLKFDEGIENESLGKWVAYRILEIFQVSHSLPSTAIFVADDDQIDHVLRVIEDPLEENSIGVKGCPKGEILGSEGKVRIFSVKYIKGLEFESVFFINLNEISKRAPQLVDKYLYVGLTRAASFLGVTYDGAFPEKIRFAEGYFEDGDWGRLAQT